MNRTAAALYTVSTVLEKNLELGVVLLTFHQTHQITSSVISGAAFQVGKTVGTRIPIVALNFWAVVSFIGACIMMLGANRAIYILGVVCLAAAVGHIRTSCKLSGGEVPRYKRLLRPAALAAAPFFNPLVTAAVAVLVFGCLKWIAIPAKSGGARWWPSGSLRRNHLAMVLHHTHFFSYVYIVPGLFLLLVPNVPLLAGVHFYAGYAGYDVWYRVRGGRMWRVFVIGHIVAGIAVAFLCSASGWLTLTSLWAITGVGAGTVCMLPAMRDADDPAPELNLALYEEYGHIIGVFLSCLLVFTIAPVKLAIVAASLAIVAGIAPMLLKRELLGESRSS